MLVLLLTRDRPKKVTVMRYFQSLKCLLQERKRKRIYFIICFERVYGVKENEKASREKKKKKGGLELLTREWKTDLIVCVFWATGRLKKTPKNSPFLVSSKTIDRHALNHCFGCKGQKCWKLMICAVPTLSLSFFSSVLLEETVGREGRGGGGWWGGGGGGLAQWLLVRRNSNLKTLGSIHWRGRVRDRCFFFCPSVSSSCADLFCAQESFVRVFQSPKFMLFWLVVGVRAQPPRVLYTHA